MSDDLRWVGPAVENFRDYLLLLARMQLGQLAGNKLEASDMVPCRQLLEAIASGTNSAAGARRRWPAGFVSYWRSTLPTLPARRDERSAMWRASARWRWPSSSRRRASGLGWPPIQRLAQPAGRVPSRRLAARLAGALTQVPEAQRQALLLRYCQDCSVEEISRRLDRTPAAVAGLLKRGLRQLRTRVDDRG